MPNETRWPERNQAKVTLFKGGPSKQSFQEADTTITILREPGKNATKRFTREGVQGYGRGYMFQWAQVAVVNINHMLCILNAMASASECFLVHGKVAPHAQCSSSIRRLLHDKANQPATLIDAPSRLLHFDVDDFSLPEGCSWSDPARTANAVWQVICQELPALGGADIIWQASCSAGTLGKEHLAKFHFWAMSDAPLTSDERKSIYKLVGTDTSVGGAVQPNYVASPIFEGVPDPLARRPRLGMLTGTSNAVSAEALKAAAQLAHEREVALLPIPSQGHSVDLKGQPHPYAIAAIKNIAFDLATLTEGRSRATYNAAFKAALWANSGHVQEGDAYREMILAAEAHGHMDWRRQFENGWRDGLESGQMASVPDIGGAVPSPEDDALAQRIWENACRKSHLNIASAFAVSTLQIEGVSV